MFRTEVGVGLLLPLFGSASERLLRLLVFLELLGVAISSYGLGRASVIRAAPFFPLPPTVNKCTRQFVRCIQGHESGLGQRKKALFRAMFALRSLQVPSLLGQQ